MKSTMREYRPQVHYYSERLKNKLNKMRDFKTTFIEAPSGAGKTNAVQDFFKNTDTKEVSIRWFVASEEPHTSGWNRLCRILGDIDPSTGRRLLHLGFPVDENQGDIAQALTDLRCEYDTYLICDNFQFIQKTFRHQYGELSLITDRKVCESLYSRSSSTTEEWPASKRSAARWIRPCRMICFCRSQRTPICWVPLLITPQIRTGALFVGPLQA